jgi:hypothetical protein
MDEQDLILIVIDNSRQLAAAPDKIARRELALED